MTFFTIVTIVTQSHRGRGDTKMRSKISVKHVRIICLGETDRKENRLGPKIF